MENTKENQKEIAIQIAAEIAFNESPEGRDYKEKMLTEKQQEYYLMRQTFEPFEELF